MRLLDTGYFRTVKIWRRTRPDVDTQLAALTARLDQIERTEARREGEWLDTLDRFDRLYKRIVARQDRERRTAAGLAETATADEARSGSGESPLSLRRRLRGT